MRKFTRAERQQRIERARDVALKLVKPDLNISIEGELVSIFEFKWNDLSITYYRPKRGSALPRRLRIRFKGAIVYYLEWDDYGQIRSSYKPGEWGPLMVRLASRSQAH